MRYKNIKTGAIIDSPSKIIGKAWVLVDGNKAEQKEEYVEEEVDLDAMTKAELIEFAKEHEIEVDEKDTKAVIIETIAKNFE